MHGLSVNHEDATVETVRVALFPRSSSLLHYLYYRLALEQFHLTVS